MKQCEQFGCSRLSNASGMATTIGGLEVSAVQTGFVVRNSTRAAYKGSPAGSNLPRLLGEMFSGIVLIKHHLESADLPLSMRLLTWLCHFEACSNQILVTIISGLDRRAFHSAVGAKHAAVTWLWLDAFAASSAVVEKDACVDWHDFPALLPAMGTGND